MQRDARIIVPTNGYADVIFRIPRHPLIHEWFHHGRVAHLAVVDNLSRVCWISCFWKPNQRIWPLRLKAGGGQSLEPDHNQHPCQPEQNEIAEDEFVHGLFF